MRCLVALASALLLSAAGATGFAPLPGNSQIFYTDTYGQFKMERGLYFLQAPAGEVAMVAASYPANNLIGWSCTAYRYLGEMSDSHLFEIQRFYRLAREAVEIDAKALAQERMAQVLLDCVTAAATEESAKTSIYVPTRFSSLYLGGIFDDARINLARVEGVVIQPSLQR